MPPDRDGPKWTEAELARLHTLYGTMTSKKLADHFPGRTPMAIRVMARRHALQASDRQPAHRWTADQDAAVIAEMRAARDEGRARRVTALATRLGLDAERVTRRIRLFAATLTEFAPARGEKR